MELNLKKECTISIVWLQKSENRRENRNHTGKSMEGILYRKLGMQVSEVWKGKQDAKVNLENNSRVQTALLGLGTEKRWGFAEPRA